MRPSHKDLPQPVDREPLTEASMPRRDWADWCHPLRLAAVTLGPCHMSLPVSCRNYCVTTEGNAYRDGAAWGRHCYDGAVTDSGEPDRTSHISKTVLSTMHVGGPWVPPVMAVARMDCTTRRPASDGRRVFLVSGNLKGGSNGENHQEEDGGESGGHLRPACRTRARTGRTRPPSPSR